MKFILAYVTLLLILCFGYVNCVVKFCKSDFNPSYKREIIYGVGIFIPPIGGVVGFMDIKDGQ